MERSRLLRTEDHSGEPDVGHDGLQARSSLSGSNRGSTFSEITSNERSSRLCQPAEAEIRLAERELVQANSSGET